DGSRAKEVFLEGSDRERAIAAERCARWLARFHAIAPRVGPALEISTHLATLKRWSRHIAEVAAPAGDKAARLVGRLDVAASQLRRVDTCAGHGRSGYAPIF